MRRLREVLNWQRRKGLPPEPDRTSVVMHGLQVPMAAIAGQQAEESALGDARTSKRIGEKELSQNDVDSLRHVPEGPQAHANEAHRNVANHDHVAALHGFGRSFARHRPKNVPRCLRSEPAFHDVWKPLARPVESIKVGVKRRNLVHVHGPDVAEKGSCFVHPPGINETNLVYVQLALFLDLVALGGASAVQLCVGPAETGKGGSHWRSTST